MVDGRGKRVEGGGKRAPTALSPPSLLLGTSSPLANPDVGKLKRFQVILRKSQGLNPALTVLCVPCSLDLLGTLPLLPNPEVGNLWAPRPKPNTLILKRPPAAMVVIERTLILKWPPPLYHCHRCYWVGYLRILVYLVIYDSR